MKVNSLEQNGVAAGESPNVVVRSDFRSHNLLATGRHHRQIGQATVKVKYRFAYGLESHGAGGFVGKPVWHRRRDHAHKAAAHCPLASARVLCRGRLRCHFCSRQQQHGPAGEGQLNLEALGIRCHGLMGNGPAGKVNPVRTGDSRQRRSASGLVCSCQQAGPGEIESPAAAANMPMLWKTYLAYDHGIEVLPVGRCAAMITSR